MEGTPVRRSVRTPKPIRVSIKPDFETDEDGDSTGPENERARRTTKRRKPNKKSRTSSGESIPNGIAADNSNDCIANVGTGEINYTEPAYEDKDWFRTNCLLCQVCKTSYQNTVDALKCFSKHDDYLRCYICFTVIEGGKDGTKHLFRHYQTRHAGDQKDTVMCPYCKEIMTYKSVSCHIVSLHFRLALGIPDTQAAVPLQSSHSSRGRKKPRKPKRNDNQNGRSDDVGKKKLKVES